MLTWWEAAAREFEQPPRRWTTPGALAQHLDPRILQTPTLKLIDRELVGIYDQTDGRLILSCPPQIGKSQRCSRWFPLWVLKQAPNTRIGIVSYEHNVARRWGRAIRDDIIGHPELGLRVRDDLAAQHEWQLDGYEGGVYTAGIGAALTGRPLDLLIIDDPLKDRAQADSQVYRDRVMEWWTDVGSTRLGPGAPVLQVATRWHEADLAGQLLAAPDGDVWRAVNIPAQADHRPEKGETDPLGREPGEYMESTRRNRRGEPLTRAQWDAVKARAGSRTWAALYQGRPSPAEGGIIKRDWWRYYQTPLWIDMPDGSKRVTGFDEILQSWDLTFKDTAKSDYVVGQVWGRIGASIYLLDQVRGRWDFPETIRQFRALSAKWPDAVLKIVEEKANGAALISMLHQQIGGIVPETPTESKIARTNAVAPLVEAHNVHLPDPELAPWIGEFVEEWAAFPNGSHDDQVDGGTQALRRLGIMPLLMEQLVDDDTDEYEYGWSISPM
ncbi:MAG: phage terminase large subunit [Propionibacteriaceae bacterium]|nr:phage terminase large subunit [Propionibacteriaceae bacterium]